MDFDWSAYTGSETATAEISESFEDPFSLRLLPDSARQVRFFSLGKTLGGKPLFVVYTSTGRTVRVITARPMTPEEIFFYDRKAKELL